MLSETNPLDWVDDPSAKESAISMPFYASSRLKRILDVALSVLGIILSCTLLPFVAFAIRVNSPGPIFYRQVRVGKGGRPFVLNKFRTMRVDAESGGNAVWAQDRDPRVTAVGRVLRRLYIDELPQFWNVLRGEMSVIGPRPERPEWTGLIEEQIPGFWLRTKVLPGITGWAQVNYKYANSIEDARIKLAYDIEYIRNSSLAMDLRILGRTLLRIPRIRSMRDTRE